MTTEQQRDRFILISADGHAGGNHDQYRAYLEAKYLERFDAWRQQYSNPFKDLTGGTRNRNWDDERRFCELEQDGVVAEVLFPNTIPPFFPTGAVVARPPSPDDYELRLAGVRAHNRWLADWCAGHSDRRAGIGQIFLNDIDDAIADVRWCHDHGLRGGVLVQPVPDDMKHVKPLYAPDHDRLWATCEDLGVIVNTHSGGRVCRTTGRIRLPGSCGSLETSFFSTTPAHPDDRRGRLRALSDTALRTDGTGCLLDRTHPQAARFVPRPDEGAGLIGDSSTTRTGPFP